ncbi:MAG: hypothetical protein ACREFE_12610 [Limisphaerales bacterium]
MNSSSAVWMLIATHLLSLGVAGAIFIWIMVLHRRSRGGLNLSSDEIHKFFPFHPKSARRPANWLAVRSVEPQAVRAALADNGEFFVSPRVNNWVIVTGSGLPNPSDDVDDCFRFLAALSRRLGHVQFFYAEKFSTHHAWARLDDGCVTRAYAWANETVWNQGAKTLAEMELEMTCFDYGENSDADFWATNDDAASNMEKIPLLASRWSVDPAILNRADDIAGESRFF